MDDELLPFCDMTWGPHSCALPGSDHALHVCGDPCSEFDEDAWLVRQWFVSKDAWGPWTPPQLIGWRVERVSERIPPEEPRYSTTPGLSDAAAEIVSLVIAIGAVVTIFMVAAHVHGWF